MKKLFIVLVLFSGLSTFSQNRIAEIIKNYQKEEVAFTRFSPFKETLSSPDIESIKVVTNATYVELDFDISNNVLRNKPQNIELNIPFQNQTISILLYKVKVTDDAFHVDTDRGVNIPYEKGLHYRGIINGDYTSVASFNFFNNELNGVVSSNQLGNLVIGKLQKENNQKDYIIYSDTNLLIQNDFKCFVKDAETHDHELDRDSNNENTILSDRCVTMYFELDYALFIENNFSTTSTSNWMTSVFNNVQTLFANDGITTSLKSIYIWTTQDPYSGTSSFDYLAQFNQFRPIFDGDVGQLLGIDEGGLGGVAVGIGTLCTSSNFSYSDVNYQFSNVPFYSWTINVISHELGHLLGSRHTHACVWNGNNTSIDGCGTQAGYQEGSCVLGPIPSTSTKGTIMSYCHLISGVGISFNNGFGPQPATAIINKINSSTCLSTDCINTCINAVSGVNFSPSTTNNSVSITWDDISGGSSWQVAVLPFSSNSPTWITVDTNSYTATGLNPNTYYKFRIRPICLPEQTATSRQIVFATAGDFCNNMAFYDTGGLGGNYTNNETFIRTFVPNDPTQKIKVDFTSFNLELDYDYLYVYDGSDTNAPDLSFGGFTGDFIPGPFESTASDGTLTFRFYSDQGVVSSGWNATVSCTASLGINDTSFLDFSYYPNPTNGIVTIKSNQQIQDVKVYNIEGRLLFEKSINDLNTQVDVSSFAIGTYFFKLKYDEKEVNFKILKQ